jgi:hypothetical protein
MRARFRTTPSILIKGRLSIVSIRMMQKREKIRIPPPKLKCQLAMEIAGSLRKIALF